MRAALAARRRAGLLRVPRAATAVRPARWRGDARWLVNFASNDYLGLAGDRRLATAAAAAAGRFGWGAGASRLVTGTTAIHAALEADVAAWLGTERALVFPNGFMANLAVLSTAASRGDVLFSDAANHASLIDGCRAARCDVVVYPHADADALDALLARDRRRRGIRWIVTDTVFSVDGDAAPLAALADVARRRGAALYLDEAHAVGVLGPEGRGLAAAAGVAPAADLRMGTFSKALGGYGAFVAGPRTAIDFLYNAARPFVYTTALPAAVCAADRAGLSLARRADGRRRRLLALAARARAGLSRRGWDVGPGAAHIVPVRVGSPRRLEAIARRLEVHGVRVGAFRPPTVPDGVSRFRVSLSAAHADADVERLLDAFGEAAGPAARRFLPPFVGGA